MTSIFAGTRPAHYRQILPKSTPKNSPQKPFLTSSLTSKMTSTADSHIQGEMTGWTLPATGFNKISFPHIFSISPASIKSYQSRVCTMAGIIGMAHSLSLNLITSKIPTL
jgi:hypothetical protein